MGISRAFTPAGRATGRMQAKKKQAGCRQDAGRMQAWLAQGAAVTPPGCRARLGGLTFILLHMTQRNGKPENPDFHFQRWNWGRKKDNFPRFQGCA